MMRNRLLFFLAIVIVGGAIFASFYPPRRPPLESPPYSFLDNPNTRHAFEQKARQGDGLAAYNLSNYYALAHNPYSTESKKLALMWIEQSAKNNYPEGTVRYANLLQLSGKREDCARAIQLLQKVTKEAKSQQTRRDAELSLEAFRSRTSCASL